MPTHHKLIEISPNDFTRVVTCPESHALNIAITKNKVRKVYDLLRDGHRFYRACLDDPRTPGTIMCTLSACRVKGYGEIARMLMTTEHQCTCGMLWKLAKRK